MAAEAITGCRSSLKMLIFPSCACTVSELSFVRGFVTHRAVFLSTVLRKAAQARLLIPWLMVQLPGMELAIAELQGEENVTPRRHHCCSLHPSATPSQAKGLFTEDLGNRLVNFPI